MRITIARITPLIVAGAAAVAGGIPAAAKGGQARSTEGRVTLTVRRLGKRDIGGDVVFEDTGTYRLDVGSDGSAQGTVSLTDGTLALNQFGADGPKRKRGKWTVGAGRAGSGREVLFTAADGAPPAEVELRRNGVTIGRIVRTWARAEGGWRLREAMTVLYENGAPVASVALSFDEGKTRVADGPGSGAGVRADAAQGRALAAGAPSFSEDLVCEAQVAAMEAAFVRYEVSVGGLTVCLAKLFKLCSAAFGNLVIAASSFEASVVAVEVCVANSGEI